MKTTFNLAFLFTNSVARSKKTCHALLVVVGRFLLLTYQ